MKVLIILLDSKQQKIYEYDHDLILLYAVNQIF